jgi:hypothetical protein
VHPNDLGVAEDLRSTNEVEPKRKRPKYSERNRDDVSHSQFVHGASIMPVAMKTLQKQIEYTR